jgi:hypothetical protein
MEGKDYYPYQGTPSVWPVAVRRIAEGYRKQGLDPIAYDLEMGRLIPGLQNAECLPEYILVDKETRMPNYSVLRRGMLPDNIPRVGAAERPVRYQTWTATAALAAVEAARSLRHLMTQSAYVPDWLDPHSSEAKICREYITRTQDLPPASKLPISVEDYEHPAFQVDTKLGDKLRGQLQRARRSS